MGFEQNLEKSLFSKNPEKTLIDKVLARKDAEEIRVLVKKERLSRSDMLQLLYLLSGVESKLMNYGQWERYVVLKFFVWIREFVKVAELMYDLKDKLEKKVSFVMSDRTIKVLDNNQLLIEHNIKFLVDLYLNISRTSLSLGATAFMELLNNRYEVVYPNATQPQAIEKKGFSKLLGGG